MNILITGASGFIGQQVVNQFNGNSHRVYLLSRESKNQKTLGKNHFWVLGDINSPEQFSMANGGILPELDVVIDLAWGNLDDFNSSFHHKEYLRHERFLHYMVNQGVKNITVAGSCLEYGLLTGELHEEMSCKPMTEYGKAKLALYKALVRLKKQCPFNLVWNRIFYAFGRQKLRKSLFDHVQAAIDNNDKKFDMSHGQQKRDFIPVKTIAIYIKQLACANKDIGIVNLCSGVAQTVENQVKEWFSDKQKTIALNLGVIETPEYEAEVFWGSTTKLLKYTKNMEPLLIKENS